MKKSYLYILMVGVFMASLSACTLKQKAVPLTPINAQINFSMDDLEYLGDATGTSTQSYVLGMAYGGRKYHSGVLLSQSTLGNILPNNRGYSNAVYDALMQKPDADFVLPVSFESVVEQQFLGNRETLTVRCKAYKLKNK